MAVTGIPEYRKLRPDTPDLRYDHCILYELVLNFQCGVFPQVVLLQVLRGR
jgi:hypothetical protein